eukprot:GHVN01078673.1.p1 GENE.GHVN01078673.1~~GHVN01078673.1.p1  ORF type:complete len:344 (+),score=30.11 GHVN01078673.1:623-1654(+)
MTAWILSLPQYLQEKLIGRPNKRAPVYPPALASTRCNQSLVYGTAWKGDDTLRLVEEALEAGFRRFDVASQPHSCREELVGEGIRRGLKNLGLNRSDVWIQTKFTPLVMQQGTAEEDLPYDYRAPLHEQVRQSLEKSLVNLQTDYIDALLLHAPLPTFEEIMATWWVFEEAVERGKVKFIGLSNFHDVVGLERVYQSARIKPSIVQNRFYKDSTFDAQLRNICAKYSICYQSFWTLTANRVALDTPEFENIVTTITARLSEGSSPSKKYKGTTRVPVWTRETVMLAFAISLGVCPCTGPTSRQHMEDDVSIAEMTQSSNIFTHLEGGAEIQGQLASILELKID